MHTDNDVQPAWLQQPIKKMKFFRTEKAGFLRGEKKELIWNSQWHGKTGQVKIRRFCSPLELSGFLDFPSDLNFITTVAGELREGRCDGLGQEEIQQKYGECPWFFEREDVMVWSRRKYNKNMGSVPGF